QHRALVIGLDPGSVEAEPSRIRAAPGRVHDQIGRDLLADASEHRIPLARVFLDAGDLGAGMDLDAAAAHLLGERDADIVIKAVEQFLAPDDFHHLAAEAAEDAGELDRDVAAADDDD